jgi:hypothetical protein
MKIAINSEHSGKHPAHLSADALNAWWRWFNGAFKNVDTSLQGLANHIHWGHAYTTQHRDYRKAANFIQGQHVGLDFDDLEPGTTLQSLVDGDPFIAKYAALLHTTASHTPAAPRIRVLFVLDRPIGKASKYTLLAEALLDRYDTDDEKPDPSCKDACRLFFGAEGCDTLSLGNVLTLEDAAEILVQPYEENLAATRKPLTSRTPVEAGGVPVSLLDSHSRKLLQKIANAPDGQKYEKLRDISRTFGGYIAGGYYDELTVQGWLEAEIRARPTVKDLDAAYRTISDGIAYGKGDALYFDIETVSQAKQETEAPAPVMASDDSWRGQAIEQRLVELEALINELEGAEPAYLPAVEEYSRLKGLEGDDT